MIHFAKPTVEQFFRTYSITNFAVSKDEKRLIFNTNMNGKMNLWAMDLPATYPYLFAHTDESCAFIEIDPENRYVLAGFDRDGDENYQMYAVPFDGGLPEPFITGDANDKFYLSHVSDDGERVYYVTSKDNPNFMNTHMRNLKTGKDVLLHLGDKAPTQVAVVSQDEEKLVYQSSFANTYVISFVKIGEETLYLTPDPDQVHIAFNPVFVDNDTIFFITDYDSDFSYVAKFHIPSKTFTKELELKEESVSSIKWVKEASSFYLTTSHGVVDKLYKYEINSATLHACTLPIDTIDQLEVAKSGAIYLLGRSATVPLNIFYSLDGVEWKQLTDNRVLGVSKEQMVEPEVVSYPSYDGLEIEALLFKPKADRDNGFTIFWPHGGPQSSERKMFRSMFQCFLNRGYSIFAPNFRGSTGYGSEFTKMVERDWGEGPRLDCITGIEWLIENGHTDRERLFLVGGSYGGYMALLLHGRHADYFKAVVDIFGVSNLFTFVESVPPHWKPMMDRWIGDPVRDKERFIKDSPVTYLEGMTKPMLVIQGAKDPRVVKEESDQIVAKLEAHGRDVEYLVLDDEGHGFSKKENEITVYSRMLDFLEKHQK
ncbi:S9 family peptidase [Sporosarcina sp. Te-1]|uniref:S9 family peptidase n=1 Tax=Sporosarcina sp. Te-1 TaxID=2818390 RepID=UPI001A9F0682|nr:S9 family peptidase [Sporosarcina sp. Te-1]QTD42555.1 S9 family peptidase [Sporosarcina sp. Te-1]